MYQRQRFVLDAERTSAAFAGLCRRYDISRKTGYKWLDRSARLGPDGLADCSHRPAALYAPSDRLFVPRLRLISYSEHFEIRRVSTNGGIRWQKRWVSVSHILATLPAGSNPWRVARGMCSLDRSTSAGSTSATTASTTAAAAANANTTCHLSGDHTYYPSSEMLTAAE
jgi:hypothetical protein